VVTDVLFYFEELLMLGQVVIASFFGNTSVSYPSLLPLNMFIMVETEVNWLNNG